ncbi:MAG: Maf family protein [Eubacteriales bacterium]|nr:Maf family protein [Eubacteriales bacterium]
MRDLLILASASPRRSDLLRQAGYSFTVLPAQGEEIKTSTVPTELVLALSMQKACEVRDRILAGELSAGGSAARDGALIRGEDTAAGSAAPDGFLILGADTVVAADGQILGKPRDEEEAFAMLSMLQGQTHQVYTGVSLLRIPAKAMRNGFSEADAATRSFVACTDVTFDSMTEAEIRAYIATGEPMDKAGAYGIQGAMAAYVREIRGEYSNVVGLPLCALRRTLREIGF